MQKWSERPKGDRGAIIGAIIGMAIAAVVAFVYAYESSTMVRYFIMAAGLWSVSAPEKCSLPKRN